MLYDEDETERPDDGDWGKGSRSDSFEIAVESPPSGENGKTVAKATVITTGEDVYLTSWSDTSNPYSKLQRGLGQYLRDLEAFSNRKKSPTSLLPLRAIVRTHDQWCIGEKMFQGISLCSVVEQKQDISMADVIAFTAPIAKTIEDMDKAGFRDGILDIESIFLTCEAGEDFFSTETWKSAPVSKWPKWNVVFSGLSLPERFINDTQTDPESPVSLRDKFPRLLDQLLSHKIDTPERTLQLISESVSGGMGRKKCTRLLAELKRSAKQAKPAATAATTGTKLRTGTKQLLLPVVAVFAAGLVSLIFKAALSEKGAALIFSQMGPEYADDAEPLSGIDPANLVFLGLPASHRNNVVRESASSGRFEDRKALYEFFRSSPAFRDQTVKLGTELYSKGSRAFLKQRLAIAEDLWANYQLPEALKWSADHTGDPERKQKARWEYFQVSNDPDYRDAAKNMADNERIPLSYRAEYAWQHYASLPEGDRSIEESLRYLHLAVSGNVREAILYNNSHQILRETQQSANSLTLID